VTIANVVDELEHELVDTHEHLTIAELVDELSTHNPKEPTR
jgi:hypothetical protein